MKMKNKILSFLIFLFLSSCGYEAVYSLKNKMKYDFSISELNFIGDRDTNLKIKTELNNYTLSKKDKNFILNISSTTEKIILAKDNSGDPTNFKIETSVDVSIFSNNILKGSFIFLETFNYANNSNKLELKVYEKEIKNSLAKTIAQKLIFKLSNVQ
jgi:hypothetical protein|tara:strand:- start:239 stop:709 length:471 start_codon:yes stop_codon:yes gene_type:complete